MGTCLLDGNTISFLAFTTLAMYGMGDTMLEQYYVCSGTDEVSDDGYWASVVKAETEEEAKEHARKYLDSVGRKDLYIENCKLLKVENNVIYANVEVYPS
jgi:hypothetical protein